MALLSKLSTRTIFVGISLLLALTILVLIITGFYIARTINSKNYLNFTPIQHVKRDPPTFHLSEPVQVESLFYNNSKQSIDFTALVFWKMIEPANNHEILQLNFQQNLKPGCTELSFNNLPPDQVKTFTLDELTKGTKKVTWQIEGTNTVIKPYGGSPIAFKVEQFSYIPDSQPLPSHKDVDKLSCN